MNDKRVTDQTRKPCIVYRINGISMYIYMMACPFLAMCFVVLGGIFKDSRASTATACGVCIKCVISLYEILYTTPSINISIYIFALDAVICVSPITP